VAQASLGASFRWSERTAMGGRSKERPELAASEIPLEARIPVIAARGGDGLLERLFGPLGYEVQATRLPLDATFPSWGESDYFSVRLRRRCRLSDLLSHLYVLIPVLDDEKHYWVGDDEVEKLLRRGEDWLPAHPERELIVNRYLKRLRSLTQDVLARLADEDQLDPDADEARHALEEAVEERIGLNRREHVLVRAVAVRDGEDADAPDVALVAPAKLGEQPLVAS
jgi:3' terminal RNA ribose 2'-O-methyltransferase Hen1